MPCYYPKLAFQHKFIKQKLRFTGRLNYRDDKGIDPYLTPDYLKYSKDDKWKPLTLSCGKCIHCRLKTSQEKGIRAMHELPFHKKACFLTLTYSPENLPKNGSINAEHPSAFVKRLRAHISYYGGDSILTFGCAEYGEKKDRPHYHLIIFGFDFPDKKFWRNSKNDWSPKKWPVYRSELLEELWPHGFSEIGTVTYESACYVARYVTKKINGKNKDEHYGDRQPERAVCVSNKTGIGLKHVQKFASEMLATDTVYTKKNGQIQKHSLPRYYSKKLEQWFPDQFRKLKEKRVAHASKPDLDLTKQRARGRQKSHEHRAKKLKRSYEET